MQFLKKNKSLVINNQIKFGCVYIMDDVVLIGVLAIGGLYLINQFTGTLTKNRQERVKDRKERIDERRRRRNDREHGEDCLLNRQCGFTEDGVKMKCCARTCSKPLKDFKDRYRCPDKCRISRFSRKGSCVESDYDLHDEDIKISDIPNKEQTPNKTKHVKVIPGNDKQIIPDIKKGSPKFERRYCKHRTWRKDCGLGHRCTKIRDKHDPDYKKKVCTNKQRDTISLYPIK